MIKTDVGHIYGLRFRYNAPAITQYISDYNHFYVYQTDLQYDIKHHYAGAMAKLSLVGKYLHLSDKNSNGFSKNAQEDYLHSVS